MLQPDCRMGIDVGGADADTVGADTVGTDAIARFLGEAGDRS